MIFGYANNSNVDFNINQYLEQNPGKTINDLTFDLAENIKIENNIFGYSFDSTKIVDLIGCNDIILQSVDGNEEIIKGKELSKNEEIKIEFRNGIKAFNCKIYYRYILIDAEYSEHIKYYINKFSTEYNFEDVHESHRNKYPEKLVFII